MLAPRTLVAPAKADGLCLFGSNPLFFGSIYASSTLLAPRPRQNAVQFAQTVGPLFPPLSFRRWRRNIVILKPQQCQRLIPSIEMEHVFPESAITIPILKPLLGICFFWACRIFTRAHAGAVGARGHDRA